MPHSHLRNPGFVGNELPPKQGRKRPFFRFDLEAVQIDEESRRKKKGDRARQENCLPVIYSAVLNAEGMRIFKNQFRRLKADAVFREIALVLGLIALESHEL